MLDVYFDIFKSLSITAKRAWICVSKETSMLSGHLRDAELEFQKMINQTKFVSEEYFFCFYNTMYKHTIELVHDECTHLIPNSYIGQENRVLYRYTNILFQIGKQGNIQFIERLLQTGNETKRVLSIIACGAAEAGHQSIIELCRKHTCLSYTKVTAYAAKGNKLELLKWLIDDCELSIDSDTARFATKNNHTDILAYLATKDCDFTYCGFPAALGSYLDTLKFLLPKINHSYRSMFLSEARDGGIMGGHLDVLKFVFAQDVKPDSLVTSYVPCKDIKILRWLLDNNHIVPSEGILESIALQGSIECFEYIYDRYPLTNKMMIDSAVSTQNIEVVQFLLKKGCVYNQHTIYNATYGNSIEKTLSTLKLFKVTELPWSVFELAAQKGYLEIIQYGHDNRVLTELHKLLTIAVKYGHLHIVVQLIDYGCKYDVSFVQLAMDSKSDGSQDIIKWFFNTGNFRSTCGLPSKVSHVNILTADSCVR